MVALAYLEVDSSSKITRLKMPLIPRLQKNKIDTENTFVLNIQIGYDE